MLPATGHRVPGKGDVRIEPVDDVRPTGFLPGHRRELFIQVSDVAVCEASAGLLTKNPDRQVMSPASIRPIRADEWGKYWAEMARDAEPGPDRTPLPPAGWYPDPWRQYPWRWWEGCAWTGHVSTG